MGHKWRLCVAATLPLIGFILISGLARAEDAVLVSSTVAEYVPGTVLTESQTLALPQGASATLLFKSGTLVKIRGPFNDTLMPGRAEGQDAAAFVQELKSGGANVSVLGA